MTIYADSSFIAPVYLADIHEPEALRRLGTQPAVWLTPFNRAELAHSLYQQVFRSRFSATEAHLAWKNFEQDCANGIWTPINLPERTWQTCADLARKHGPNLGVRTLDSLHVACALELKAQRFWTFDERQARLAEASVSIQTPELFPRNSSLRSNNPSQRMTPRQHNPAMIHLRRWPAVQIGNRQTSPLNQRPSTSWAPVRQGFLVQHRPALTANSLHNQKITRSPHFPPANLLQFSASSFAENSLPLLHNGNRRKTG